MTYDKRRDRLRFRSWHRGTREMDLLLGTFADQHLPSFDPTQLDEFETLLDESDPELYNWVIGKEPLPTDKQSSVLRLFCAHTFQAR